eukprot:NODE_2798_length_1037_cov_3.988866_g2339_i0.p2 GENE.NODE_2798_length_1037_cov_3.988866_g2339_i0~~NODE_2798_length_1037_cov_3.988866_g2339_i0.p2  ORF type:complete len:103 (+),score=22.72 NODE_2798_length_1037_cov_3.988866_g2339_i0:715-1023(+)
MFDPQTPGGAPIDTDNWVLTLKNMGVKQACFTAHHCGGFAMWPSRWTNYSIANSPYGKKHPGADLVRQFVTSCRKYDISPCIYIAPQIDCNLAHLPPAEYQV